MEQNKNSFKKQVEVYLLNEDRTARLATIGYVKVKKKDFDKKVVPAAEEGNAGDVAVYFPKIAQFSKKCRKYLGVSFNTSTMDWTFVTKEYLKERKEYLSTEFRSIKNIV